MKKVANHIERVRRGFGRVAILAVLAFASVGLTQCRLIDSSVTGLDAAPQDFHGRNNCIKRCQNEYEDAMKKERARHKAALRACDRCRNTREERECRKAEDRLHDKIQDNLKDQKRVCKSKCYNEGGGRGGR